MGILYSKHFKTISAFFMILLILFFSPLPLSYVFLLLALVGFVFYFFKISGNDALLLSCSLLISIFIIEGMLNFALSDDLLYYRPQERFGYSNNIIFEKGCYKKNVNYQGMIRHGDLASIDVKGNVEPEPRQVKFKTDRKGFRNAKVKADYILIGDSFVVGNGLDQDDIISTQLTDKYKALSYNIACPGDVTQYTYFIRQATKDKDFQGKKFILFLFEGNDFGLLNGDDNYPSFLKSSSLFQQIYNSYKTSRLFFKNSLTFRYVYATLSRIYKLTSEDRKLVEIYLIKNKKVAFLRSYNEVSKQKELLDLGYIHHSLNSVKQHIHQIYFIPTKYRVYCQFINECKSLPNRQWEFTQQLGKKLGIETYNLTNELRKKSQELLEDEKFSFWRDDTHWNRKGVSIAAKVIAANLELKR